MWGGQFSRVKKQSLSGNKGGAGSTSETRQEILERTRRERAERLRSRREEDAALVIQKVWRSWMARRMARERWVQELSAVPLSPFCPPFSSSTESLESTSRMGQKRRLRMLIAAVDPEFMSDVVLLAREVQAFLDSGVFDEMLMRVVGALGSVQDIEYCDDDAAMQWFMVVRDLFQLSVQCLAAQAREFIPLRAMTFVALQGQAGNACDEGRGSLIEVAHVLASFALKVLRTSKLAFFDVSLQKVCLWQMRWRFQGDLMLNENGCDAFWVKEIDSRVVQDVVDVVNVLLPQELDGGTSQVCVGETLLTAVMVCIFSGTRGMSIDTQSRDKKARMDLAILRIMEGVRLLFKRCRSVVPLAGKMWASAMESIERMAGKNASGSLEATYSAQKTALERFIPEHSIEQLLVNLVHCLDCMHAQGRLGNASRRSLLVFIALVDLVLGEVAHSRSLRGRESTWHVSAEAFVGPLAEANVMLVMASTLLGACSSDTNLSQNEVENPALESVAMAHTFCSFLLRLIGDCGSQTVQTKIILTLAVKANMAGLLWKSLLKDLNVSSLRNGAGDWRAGSTHAVDFQRLLPAMILFCETFAMSLNVLGDDGFYERGLPIPIREVYLGHEGGGETTVLDLLKALLWQVAWHEKLHTDLSMRFLKAGGKLLTLLHERNGRRPFAPLDAFYAANLPRETFHAAAVAAIGRGDIEKMHVEISGVDHSDDSSDETNDMYDTQELMGVGGRGDAMDVDVAVAPRGGVSKNTFRRVVDVLQYAYPLVPFLERVRVFQSIVEAERVTIGDSEAMSGVFFGGMSRERFVNVHRGRVLEDAYGVLGQRKSAVDVKKRIRISFVNEFGEQEAGIDGGGVFKEFLESVVRESVAADKGLFLSTTDNKLYPAPTASLTTEQLNLLEFVGMMVGKALWEGVLLDLPLASFFLKKIRGASSGVDDLPSLDPEMAKNLSYLAHNPESVADMGLTFSISTVSASNTTTDVELVRGGKTVPVTAANVAHFIHRVANFKLNEQIKTSCDAFLNGFHAIVPKEWVFSFNDSELQMLIGGAEGDSRMDLVDLQRHVVYTGGYDEQHHTIANLWHVLGGMNNAELADFLRFVTSCPRPPILGFGSLQPPLTIQMVQSGDRLPTAATCVNLLKLPAYDSLQVLKEKLLYAIKSHAGFDLS